MSFKVFNTLSRQLEEFLPLSPPRVTMYTCGPTVYDFAHIGNFRAYVFEDILRRHIKYWGFEVVQVMNLTDVDDKTTRYSIEADLSLIDYTQKYKDAFFEDLKLLNIETAEYYPAATDHVSEMIDIIQTLFDNGYAYKSADGSVYFNITKFKDYGKLAKLDLSGMKPGARVSQDEYMKENIADFALWKAWTEADGGAVWDSPWGRGRPGWHIECSAMSMKYLGPTIDIHTGGIDNMFPHHEDEIAQSEAATGKTFVRYWMHCAHLMVDGEKMSKSLGNFYTLRQLMEKGWSGREIRYVLIAAQYRQALNFTFESLTAARTALGRIDDFRIRLGKFTDGSLSGATPSWINEFKLAFKSAMDDDLNTPEALAVIFGLLHATNKSADAGTLSPADAAQVLATMSEFDRVLGVLETEESVADESVMALVERRQQARADKDWKLADELRDMIRDKGWVVKDTPSGPEVRKS
ncbi:MAG: cysteine--tRNA ligase [Lentisphaerae bacterium]|nr:cysteine--tRNA ligase [Lentisphaerota bacterium]